MYILKCNHGLSGWSITELMVVIGMVSMLSGMGLAALKEVHKMGDGVQCISNLRQLSVAFQLYAESHDDYLPYPNDAYGYAGTWFNALDPYLVGRKAGVSNAVQNLHFVKQDPIIKKLGPSWFSNAYTLKMNQRLGENASGEDCFYRMGELTQPASTVLLFDGRAETEKLASGGPAALAKNPQGTEGFVARRHFNGAHILFVSGHVERRVEKQQANGGLGWAIDETRMIWKPWIAP